MVQTSLLVCNVCNWNHRDDDYGYYLEPVNFVGNFNHPSFSWSNNNNLGSRPSNRPTFPPSSFQQPTPLKKPTIYDKFEAMMGMMNGFEGRIDSQCEVLSNKLHGWLDKLKDTHRTSIQKLDIQIGKLVQSLHPKTTSNSSKWYPT